MNSLINGTCVEIYITCFLSLVKVWQFVMITCFNIFQSITVSKYMYLFENWNISESRNNKNKRRLSSDGKTPTPPTKVGHRNGLAEWYKWVDRMTWSHDSYHSGGEETAKTGSNFFCRQWKKVNLTNSVMILLPVSTKIQSNETWHWP